MHAVDLAEILWALIRVEEVQYLLSRDNRVKVAEGKMSAQFLVDPDMPNREDVEANLFVGLLLDHRQKETQLKQGIWAF